MADFLNTIKSNLSDQERALISVICPAIQSQSFIRFWYTNTSGRKEWRIVEPHLVGLFVRKNVQLTAWLMPSPEQILAGQQQGWRSYQIKKISFVEILEQKFQKPREGYDPGGNGMAEVICSLKK